MEHEQISILHSIVIPYVNFFIFLAVLVLVARKPLRNMAAGRREKYLEASKEAARALDRAKEQFSLMKAKYDSLEAELSNFKKQSEELAKIESEKMVSEGERIATQILQETKRLATEEIARARRELRDEIVQAAKKVAEEKISSSLNDSDKSRILAGKMKDLQSYQVQ